MRSIFFIIIILTISGCGMMGHSSKSDSSYVASSGSDDNISDGSLQIAQGEDILPKNISMDFPSILKQDSYSEDLNESDYNNTTSIGYQELKNYISQIEDIVKIAQINLILLKKAMPQVLQKCNGMSSCTFEPNYISIVLDNETISEIDKIVDDKNFTQINEYQGRKVNLGELNFQKTYLENRDGYKYELKLDLTSKDKFLEEIYKDKNRTKKVVEESRSAQEYQIFKWFDYTQDVTTIYFYKDSNKSVDVRIYYSVDEDGKESMHILNSTQAEDIKNNMNLTLSEKDDDNSTIQLTANSIKEQVVEDNKTVVNSFSSNGEISDDSSLILFSGTVADENETQQSPILSEVICNSSECIENNLTKSLEDNSSDENLTDITTSTQEEEDSNFTDINESVEELRENLKFYQIRIYDTNLSDGSYIILPPYTDIENLSVADIFKLTIGTFTILDGKAQGEIHSSEYNDMLDELTIVKVEEDLDDDDGDDLSFKVIEDVPKIEIIDPLAPLESDNQEGVDATKFYLQPQYLEYLEQSL